MSKIFVPLNPPPTKVDGGASLIFFLLAFHRLLDHIETVMLEPVRIAVNGLHDRVAAEVVAEDD